MYCWTSSKCCSSRFMGWARKPETVSVASYVASGQATGRASANRKKAGTTRNRPQIENALAAARCEFAARDISPFQRTSLCEPPCAARLPRIGAWKISGECWIQIRQPLRNHACCHTGDSTRCSGNLYSAVFGDPAKCPILNNESRARLATFVLLLASARPAWTGQS